MRFGEGDFLDRGEAFRHQQVGDHVVDVQSVDEELRAGLELFGPALGLFVLGHDVDVPAGELAGEPDVLTAAADRQTQLVIGDDDFNALAFLVHHDLGDLGRSQGVHHEGRRVLGPGNDVDLFALKLTDHGLDAAAAHADAGADRIDRAVVAQNRDLGTGAGVAGDRLDLDDAVVDLGHFLRKQLRHESGMGARQEDLGTAGFGPYVIDVRAYAVAVLEVLARQQLVAPQDRFGPAQIDRDIAIFDPLDQAVDDLADAILVFLELALPFGLADLLDDDLLGGLGGDPAEIDRRQFVGQELA